MLTKAHAAAVLGIGAEPVEIEVHALASEEPRTRVVGLPDAAVKESVDRVQAALRNSGFGLKPAAVTINLAPADLRKEGPVYDLPIALALLAAREAARLPLLGEVPVLGELALSGVTSLIPFDEMAEAMYQVGTCLPAKLRETAMGGAAATPTGCALCRGGKQESDGIFAYVKRKAGEEP